MTITKVKLSDKKKIYLCIPRIFRSCWSDLIHSFINQISPGQKIIRTELWNDQSMIPEEMRERMTWTCKKYQFHNLPEDNFIITQNVGDTYYNSAESFQIMIFMDEEYLPIINKAIDEAKEEYDRLKAKDWDISEIIVLQCLTKSNIVAENPIRHYYKDFGVQYPDIEWFL